MFGFKNAPKKPSANPLVIGLFWSLAFMTALIITLLSLVSIAEADFYRNGDYQVTMALGQRSYYEGNDLQLVVNLTNTSGSLKFIDLSGSACQASYEIFDNTGRRVFPRYAEEKPCNNSGYESFYIYPTQKKRYQFILGGKILPVGKYTAVGSVEQLGVSQSISFEVIKKPNFFAQEGELCEGATGRICDANAGLSCQFVSGFPLGAGLCLPKYNDYTPVDKCKNGVQNCFNDVNNHPNQDVIDKYAIQGKLSAFGTGDFRPDDPIEIETFTKVVNELSGKKIIINSSDKYLQRDTAIEVLYRVYIDSNPPNRSLSCPFTDLEGNPKKAYVFAAYKKGLLDDNPENKFYPNQYISRAHALVLIDRFEKFRG